MQYSRHAFLADDADTTDEIDKLFEQLQQIKPPPSLIQKILKSVSHLPSPPQRPFGLDIPAGQDGPIVRKDNLPPS